MAKTSINFQQGNSDNFDKPDSNPDIEKFCLEADKNRLATSDLFGFAFRMKLNTLSERQLEIVDLVKNSADEGMTFEELEKLGINTDEVSELVKKGILKTPKDDGKRFIYREFLTPKNH